MRITKLTFALLTLAGLAFVASYFGGQTSRAAAPDSRVNAHWKGASQLVPVAVGPNVARCGAFPENIEIQFSGSGIDTEGGVFDVAASSCTNTTTNLIFDLKATDTYVQSGDQVFIVQAPRPAQPATLASTSPTTSHPATARTPPRTCGLKACSSDRSKSRTSKRF